MLVQFLDGLIVQAMDMGLHLHSRRDIHFCSQVANSNYAVHYQAHFSFGSGVDQGFIRLGAEAELVAARKHLRRRSFEFSTD